MGKRLFFGSCLLFIVVIIGILGVTYTNVTKSNEINSVQEVEQDVYYKTDSHGAVTVIAKWLNPGINENELKFELTMNTHSVNLDPYDVAGNAEVYMDNNLVQSSMKTVKEGGGHHVVQNLNVPLIKSGAVLTKTKTIKLVLKNLDNIPRREFTWTKSN